MGHRKFARFFGSRGVIAGLLALSVPVMTSLFISSSTAAAASRLTAHSTSRSTSSLSATGPGVAGVTMGAGGETWFLNLSSSEQASWIQTMVADGVKWLRIDSPGNLAGWYNTEIKDAEQAGINVDAIIQTWGMSSVTPSTMGPMCTGQVDQLEPLGVQTYEVINEPNVDGGPDFYTAAQYEPLLAACYSAIKAVDPAATVLMGSLADQGGSDAAATYLAAVYAAGGEPYFDAMGMHPSDWAASLGTDQQTPTTAADCPTNAWNPWVDCPDTPANVSGGQQQEISAVRTVLDENGDSSKAIWLTEFGCPTGTSGGYPDVCTDSMLATQITDAYAEVQTNPNDEYGLLGPLWVYDWIDTDSTDDPNGSGYDDFGLYTDTGAPEPGVVSAFEAAAAQSSTTDPTTTTTTTTTTTSDPTTTTDPPSSGGSSSGGSTSGGSSSGGSSSGGSTSGNLTPTHLAAALRGNSVTLSWVNPSGAQGDDVYRDGKEIASPGLVSSFDDSGLPNGSHTYYVVAFNTGGVGPASSSVTVRVTTTVTVVARHPGVIVVARS